MSTVEKIAARLDEENARALVAGLDVVLDGSDNFATRYAVSDACFYESGRSSPRRSANSTGR